MRTPAEIIAAVQAKQAARSGAAKAADKDTGNPPALECALVGMLLTENALQELAQTKTGECQCDQWRAGSHHVCRACELHDMVLDARGSLWSVRLFRSILDCMAYPMPDPVKRLEAECEQYFLRLDPAQLAEAVLLLAEGDGEDADPPAIVSAAAVA